MRHSYRLFIQTHARTPIHTLATIRTRPVMSSFRLICRRLVCCGSSSAQKLEKNGDPRNKGIARVGAPLVRFRSHLSARLYVCTKKWYSVTAALTTTTSRSATIDNTGEYFIFPPLPVVAANRVCLATSVCGREVGPRFLLCFFFLSRARIGFGQGRER